jgi:hypothetical protein
MEESKREKENQKRKLHHLMKETSIELALESTNHGLNKLFRSKTTEFKIIWSFLVVASAAACIYVIYLGVAKYLMFNVVATVTDIEESPIEFPTVSICNFSFKWRFYLYRGFRK